MVYISYWLFPSCEIHASVLEVLQNLSSGMGRYLDIARVGFEDASMYVP